MKCCVCNNELEGEVVITPYVGNHCDAPDCHEQADAKYKLVLNAALKLDINAMPDNFSLWDFELLSLSVAIDICNGIKECAADPTSNHHEACLKIVTDGPYVLIPSNMALEVKKAVIEKLRDWVTITNHTGWKLFLTEGQFVWNQPVPKRAVFQAFYQCDLINHKQSSSKGN